MNKSKSSLHILLCFLPDVLFFKFKIMFQVSDCIFVTQAIKFQAIDNLSNIIS